MRVVKNFGLMLLAVWLILNGLIPLLRLSFTGLGIVMACLSLVAGILMLAGR